MISKMKEDGEHAKLSVYTLFCELFPEIASARGNLLRPALVFQVVRILFLAGNNKILRLHFNKIGYQVYEKEQSRRVFILTHSNHFLRQNLFGQTSNKIYLCDFAHDFTGAGSASETGKSRCTNADVVAACAPELFPAPRSDKPPPPLPTPQGTASATPAGETRSQTRLTAPRANRSAPYPPVSASRSR